MSTPTAPMNVILATIKNKHYDFVEYESGVKLYKDTCYHPEESAMLEATVVSVPRTVQRRVDYAGMRLDVHPGDKILMRYDVVYSYVDQPEHDTPIYKNVVLFGGEEYWKVDIQKIFGIIHADRIEMINGYVLCDILYGSGTNSTIILPGNCYVPEFFKPETSCERLRIKYMGAPLDGQPALSAKAGDTVLVQPGVSQKYEINTDKFYIIRQSHIVAKE